MKISWAAGAVAALAFSSPALAERSALTPSGRPDAVFPGSDLKGLGSKIANVCMNKGWTVTSQTENQLVCEVPVGLMTSAFQQVLLGNSYSTTPKTFVRFSLAQVGPNARAQANSWVETQMAFGQVRQQPYTDDNTFNGLLNFLGEAGGELPPGTRVPGIYLGFDGQPLAVGKRVVIPVQSVNEVGPGAQAGLRVGDRIHKVNGQAFKSLDDFKRKLNKVSIGVQYPLDIERGGSNQTLIVVAQERPIVGTPEWQLLVQPTSSSQPPAVPVATTSVDR